jgi:hypothetical protein
MNENNTICTYEHPAALHDIDQWRATMESEGKISNWEARSFGTYKVSMRSGETMYICPISTNNEGRIDPDALLRVVDSKSQWTKWIHFGKLLFSARQYEKIASKVASINWSSRSNPKDLKSEGI